jgi:hypothetical protein
MYPTTPDILLGCPNSVLQGQDGTRIGTRTVPFLRLVLARDRDRLLFVESWITISCKTPSIYLRSVRRQSTNL